MKLIIYWLATMAVLPLFYLWWWKKQWRLILGVIILSIAAIGFFIPGEITFSILAREIEKESKTKENKSDNIINDAANQKSNSENSEKIKQAKEIVELNKEIKKLEEESTKTNSQKVWLQNQWAKNKKKEEKDQKKLAWIRKWTKEKFLSALLFCGDEFNKKLTNKKVIDFANYHDKNPEEVKEKIFHAIEEAEKNHNFFDYKDFFVIWLKNIDQITNPKLRQWLLEIFDTQKDNDFWKYKDKDNKEIIPDLLRLIFVLTTSTSNPEYLSDYKQKFHHIETLDKYFWTIVFSSIVIEIIIFLLLIKNKKKTENKALEKFSY